MLFNKTSNCPHGKVEETSMIVQITLVTGKANSGTKSTLNELFGNGALDSPCTKAIRWRVKGVVCSETECNSLFRFGDEVESKRIKTKYSNNHW